ncbi:MAG TPA: sugar phosphate isomerase/epimerase family protein [Dehalococcoidia bacterium]|nr:sugar phosphate isomerase/epimerase family protein [Dehalococcoidia bacterium]
MKLGLNGATIMRSPIEDDVTIAAETGFSAIEFWAAKLDAHDGPLEQLGERVRASGLMPSCVNSIENITARDGAGRQAVLEELRHRVAMARALGAPAIVVVPSCVTGAVARSEAIADAVDTLRAMSDEAGDVTLAFEFLGKPGCTVPTLDMAIEIVERVDRANVGIVLDVFHFYAGGSALEDVRRIPLEKLQVVHLNGAENLPKSQLTDAHRLYPGEGVVPAVDILRLLRERGYDGVASVEIFRPEYWEQDPRTVARAAFTGATGTLLAAGYALASPTSDTAS